jgi:hypothetical protein
MTDDELDAVMAATRTVPREKRAAFLQAIGYALETSADVGHGVVARAIAATKRDTLGPRLMTTIVLR